MAGHSKWANIKHRKGRQDAARGKLFAKLAKRIEVAARMAATHSATRAGSAIRHAPILLFCTRSLGQPTFRFTSR